MEVAFRFDLQKKKAIAWPRLEDAEHIMVAGSARPLSDALRIAFVELIDWLVAGLRLRQGGRVPARLAGRGGARGEHGRPALHRGREVPEAATCPERVASGTAPGTAWPTCPGRRRRRSSPRDRVVVLPLGAAAKEHGPHLTLRNDEILAEYYADRVLAARAGRAAADADVRLLSGVPRFPGSTSVSFDTQRDTVAQIVRSVARHGPRRFYVLNTGVSTARPLKATAELLAAEGIVLHYSDVLQIGKAAEEAVREQKFGTHADEIETSMVLYMRPGTVRMEKAVADGGAERRAAR